MSYNHKKLFVNKDKEMYFTSCPGKHELAYSRLITNEISSNNSLEYLLSTLDYISIIKSYCVEKEFLVKSLYFNDSLDYNCTELYELIELKDKGVGRLINLLTDISIVDQFGVKLIELESMNESIYIGVDGDFGVKNNCSDEAMNISKILYDKIN